MDPMPKQTIEHFTHLGHQLDQVYAKTEYTCVGCKTLGQGSRYQCSSKSCYHVLHDYCATCPPSLSSFMHPQHPLTLVVRNPQQSIYQNDRYCDVCREPVEGLFYRCKNCDFDFDVHPLCTQLPRELRHALDQSHPLIFEAPVLPSPCSVCGTECSSWRNGCGACGLDIYLECLLKPYVPPTQRSIRPSGPNSNHPLPYPPPLPYGHPPPYPLPPPSPYGHPPPYPLPPPSPYGHPPLYQLPLLSPYGHPPPYPLPQPLSYGHPPPYPLLPPSPYGHLPPYLMPPPYGHPLPPPSPPPPPPPKPYDYGYGSGYAYGVPSGYGCGNGSGVPSGYSDYGNMYNNGNQAQGHGEKFKKFGKRMFVLVAQLTLGVVSNGIFGLAFPTGF